VNDWEISTEESCSDHNFLTYKIGTAKSYTNTYNYQSVRYIVKEDKYHEHDRKLAQEILKIFKNLNHKGSAGDMDKNLATTAAKEMDLERLIHLFTESIQSASREAFKIINTQNKTKKKSVPWWSDSLTIMRKRINALRRLYKRTRNNESLRENRKQKYFEEKKKYKYEIRKEKLNTWKEYCNVAASINPWSYVYKLATGKARTNSITTTLKKPDETETSSILETMNMLDYLITEDGEEEKSTPQKHKENGRGTNQHQRRRRIHPRGNKTNDRKF
jgi:hypothetical protein